MVFLSVTVTIKKISFPKISTQPLHFPNSRIDGREKNLQALEFTLVQSDFSTLYSVNVGNEQNSLWGI
jgi:hypothetical protein